MERNQLNDLVNTMISYNLTYRQEKNEDGNYVYVLEPLVKILFLAFVKNLVIIIKIYNT